MEKTASKSMSSLVCFCKLVTMTYRYSASTDVHLLLLIFQSELASSVPLSQKWGLNITAVWCWLNTNMEKHSSEPIFDLFSFIISSCKFILSFITEQILRYLTSWIKQTLEIKYIKWWPGYLVGVVLEKVQANCKHNEGCYHTTKRPYQKRPPT